MPAPGKFIVLEGIDGSGKRTQLERLASALAQRGVAHACLSFPRYEGFFGRLVARFLNGEFGPLEGVDPHFSALLYAGDRLEAKPYLEAELTSGAAVLADRYIASNLAHQGARVARERREEFLRWLRQLEYEIYGLPVEDLVVYLRLPAAAAQGLVGRKGVRDYTTLRRDLQEADLSHLEAASEVYDGLARQRNWVTIECLDAARTLRPPDSIHREVLAAVETRLFSGTPAR
jgi:dTMP kinase